MATHLAGGVARAVAWERAFGRIEGAACAGHGFFAPGGETFRGRSVPGLRALAGVRRDRAPARPSVPCRRLRTCSPAQRACVESAPAVRLRTTDGQRRVTWAEAEHAAAVEEVQRSDRARGRLPGQPRPNHPSAPFEGDPSALAGPAPALFAPLVPEPFRGAGWTTFGFAGAFPPLPARPPVWTKSIRTPGGPGRELANRPRTPRST